MYRYDLVLLNRLAMQLKRKIVKELLCAGFTVKVKYIGMQLFAMNELPPIGNRSISDRIG